MPTPIRLLEEDFIRSYQNSPERFHELIRSAFDKASELNPKNGIDTLFTYLLGNNEIEWTLNQVKYMIELGADPRDDEDAPLYHSAFRSSSKDVAEYLIDNFGAQISSEYICSIFQYSHHHKASLDTFRLFLDRGFRIEEKELYKIVENGEILEILLDHGYDINTLLKCISEIKCFENSTRCKEQFQKMYMDVDKIYSFIISQLGKIDTVDVDVLHKLFYQLRYDKKITVEGIRVFINAGMDPRYNNDRFFVKLCRHNTSIARFFINEHGVDVNAHNGKALYYALMVNNRETIKLLLDSGATVSDKHLQIALEHEDNMEFLHKYGISEQVMAAKLNTYLRNKSFISTAKQLVNNGMDFNVVVRKL